MYGFAVSVRYAEKKAGEEMAQWMNDMQTNLYNIRKKHVRNNSYRLYLFVVNVIVGVWDVNFDIWLCLYCQLTS